MVICASALLPQTNHSDMLAGHGGGPLDDCLRSLAAQA